MQIPPGVGRSNGTAGPIPLRPPRPIRLFEPRSVLLDMPGPVIVTPSPHGEYKTGISYSDALAAAEIYANLRPLGQLDVRTPELLGDNIRENLILIGGKKANPVTKNFQSLKQASLSFDLDDGVIYDKERHAVLTPEYIGDRARTIANVIADYGLIVYTGNPFGKSTRILHLAGIKGFGTFAAAVAVVEPGPVRTIEKILRRLIRHRDASQLKKLAVEILVRVSVSNGRARRNSLEIQKIKVSNGRSSRTWESEAYSQLKPVSPHGLYIDVMRTTSKTPIIRTRIDNEEIKFAKSADRMNTIYSLAKQAREDYLNQSENKGWVSALELAERLWQIKHNNGTIEISSGMRREISEAITRWARHLQRQGKLILPGNTKLDHDYVNSEILLFDSDLKKKIVDLIHIINHEEKNRFGSGFQLIESKPGLGYRINLHPALIFITEKDSADPQ